MQKMLKVSYTNFKHKRLFNNFSTYFLDLFSVNFSISLLCIWLFGVTELLGKKSLISLDRELERSCSPRFCAPLCLLGLSENLKTSVPLEFGFELES